MLERFLHREKTRQGKIRISVFSKTQKNRHDMRDESAVERGYKTEWFGESVV